MKEHYVTYEQAIKLKEMGFDELCYNFWSLEPDGKPFIITSTLGNIRSSDLKGRDVTAPFLWQAQAWLREVKGVEIVVEPRFCNYKRIGYDWNVYDDCSNDYALRAPLPFSETYERALSDGISGALELLTNKY